MKNNSYSDFLKQENELTKLKIQAEFGLQVAGESTGLNPAIENIWLKQILDYERAMVSSEKITIGERLGNPVLKPVSEINKEEFTNELHSILRLMQEKNLVLDTVAGASDEELYRFISEELMHHEVESNTPPNMLTCFIYEEFHPNHEYDVRRRGQDLINALERDDEIDFSFYVSAEGDEEIHEIQFEHLKRKLQLFKQAFDSVKVNVYDVTSVVILDETAEMHFNYKLSVVPAESKIAHIIKGKGKFTLRFLYDWWSIIAVEMKGVI
jgi:hypothetical protein